MDQYLESACLGWEASSTCLEQLEVLAATTLGSHQAVPVAQLAEPMEHLPLAEVLAFLQVKLD